MGDFMINLIKEYGDIGFYLSMLIEGSAFPFIGTFIVITYGFITNLSVTQLIFLSIVGALLYTVGSLVPYYLGLILGKNVFKRLKEENKRKIEIFTDKFSKHGVWSVAISSPLHLGNIVPLVAGISKMNIWIYSLLTFLGIMPTTFLFLLLGQIVDINIQEMTSIINKYQTYITGGLVLLLCIYVIKKVRQTKWHQSREKAL